MREHFIVNTDDNSLFPNLTFCNIAPDSVTMYGERRTLDKACGEDAYPLVAQIPCGEGKVLHMTLADDGLGSGSTKNYCLQKYIEDYMHEFFPDTKPSDTRRVARLALGLLLRRLFPELFSEKEIYEEVRAYAERNFGISPLYSFFGGEKDETGNDYLPPLDEPFFKRTSAYVGARLTSVAMYYFLIRYFRDENHRVEKWDAENTKALCDAMTAYVQGELKDNLLQEDKWGRMFGAQVEYEDGNAAGFQIGSNVLRYYLPNTFGIWLAVEDGEDISAACFHIGDVRCYVVDGKEGVWQVSCDDAFPDNAMSAFISFGPQAKQGEMGDKGYYTDNIIKCRYMSLKKPCALLSLSDGVYDTAEADDPGFRFEAKLQETLRQCRSMDDVFYLVAKRHYFHVDSFEASRQYNTLIGTPAAGVKLDDSASMALKAFWTEDVYQFSDLLAGETRLDRMIKLEKEGKIMILEPKPRVKSKDTNLFAILSGLRQALDKTYKKPIQAIVNQIFEIAGDAIGGVSSVFGISGDGLADVLGRNNRGKRIWDSYFQNLANVIFEDLERYQNGEDTPLSFADEHEAISAQVREGKITRLFYSEADYECLTKFAEEHSETVEAYLSTLHAEEEVDPVFEAEKVKYALFCQIQRENCDEEKEKIEAQGRDEEALKAAEEGEDAPAEQEPEVQEVKANELPSDEE